MESSFNTYLALLVTFLVSVKCQLVINVSSGEPDANIYRQSVTGNLSSETVTIEFLTTAGVGVVQVTDFRAGLTITSVTVPGEEELGEPEYQVLCFVTPGVGDMIPPEAVTKLPLSPLWSFLFFMMLITLGLDSQFTMTETITTALMDQWPQLRPKKSIVVLSACGLGFLLEICRRVSRKEEDKLMLQNLVTCSRPNIGLKHKKNSQKV